MSVEPEKGRVVVLLANSAAHDSRVRRHIGYLTSKGFGVTLASRDRNPPAGLRLERHVRWPYLKPPAKKADSVSSAPAERPFHFFILKYLLIRIYNFIAFFRLIRVPASFYVANDLDTLSCAAALAKLKKAKLLYDCHEIYAGQLSNAPGFYRAALERMEKRGLERADAVSAVNQPVLGYVLDLKREPVLARVVRNVPEYDPRTAEVPKEPALLLYHGNLSKGRGLSQLIEAMERLPGVSLILRGSGELEPYLRRMTEEKKLSGRVIFEPPVPPDQVVRAAARAQIGISLIEPTCENHRIALPNRLFEYIHAGLAVVATDLPEMKRVIEEYGCGIVVSRAEPATIAREISKLLGDPKLLAELQERSRRAAETALNFGCESAAFDTLIRDGTSGSS